MVRPAHVADRAGVAADGPHLDAVDRRRVAAQDGVLVAREDAAARPGRPVVLLSNSLIADCYDGNCAWLP